MSNLLSEVVESICSSVEDPYEVISSTDMLSRVEQFNKDMRKEAIKRIEDGEKEWDWRDEWMLLGSDVVSLFPSLTAQNTARIVREQLMKSKIVWQNLDDTWLRLYVHLNREKIDVSKVSHLLPSKKKGRRGKESGMSALECKKRHLVINGSKSCWEWPEIVVSEHEKKELLSLAMEVAILFFFENFTYTFGGEYYVQMSGGPIGARLTMALARLVMQDWSEQFSRILKKNGISEHLRGIYVDDGRNIIDILMEGTRYEKEKEEFVYKREWAEQDRENNVDKKKRTEIEIKELMNSINSDLKFTTEVERDFEKKRLPTLSFELWSEKDGVKHSYFEKSMRSQVLTMKRSSQAENSKMSILVNELVRRFEVMDDNLELDEETEVLNHFKE